MKNTFMSSFQKEQYTQYLQTQLQKFSAFMLGQRKENQKYKLIEQACQTQNQIIDQMRSRMELMEIGQRQNAANCEKLFRKHQNWENVEVRVRRLEDRERFDCDHELKKRAANSSSLLNEREKDLMKIQAVCSELGKKIKRIQEDLMRNKEMSFGANQGKLYYHQEKDGEDNDRFVDRVELKKLQKKIKKYLVKKIGNADEVVFQKHKSRSKSPSYKTPIEGVSRSQDESLHSQKVLSQFRFDDSNLTKGKSDISTVSRLSNNMDNESRKKVSEFRKKKSKQARSKSKGKENQKSISRSKSKSRTKLNNKSINLSQKSYLSSQLSRSKSNTSKLNKSLSKKSKKLKKARPDVSVSKSCHSSISHTHEKCKKRPEEPLNKKPSKARPKKQVSPLSKRKGRKLL